MPAALVMQGLVHVGRMGNEGQASTNQKTLFGTINLSLMHFTKNIRIPESLFCAKSFQTNYIVATMALRGLTLSVPWALYYSDLFRDFLSERVNVGFDILGEM